MTLLYTHPDFLEHQTGVHPEKPERLRRVTDYLATTGLAAQCMTPTWASASHAQLTRIHDPGHIEHVRAFAARGGGRIETDTQVSARSYDVAALAAGSVCDAVERVVRGDAKTALCLVRPPGHHALFASAMGFCLFNNVAVGAALATEGLDLDRVMVVDWDVHHGNGTQDAFWSNGRVGLLSIHRAPFYPGTGSEQETGSGAGQGCILNLPTEFGVSRPEFLDRFRRGLEHLAAKMKPQLILISAGFDAHRLDPIGSLGLETEDFRDLTQFVLATAQEYAGGKCVSVLEGGYNIEVLPQCIHEHLSELLVHDR